MLIYIGLVLIDDSKMSAIQGKHHITRDEIVSALQWPARTLAAWQDHPVHGRRLVVSGTTWSGRAILAALLPVDELDGTWRLRHVRVRND